MRTSSFIRATVLTLGISAVMAGPSLALDASKVLDQDAKPSTVFELFFGMMEEGKTEDALDILRYAADKGDSAAQWKLARIYQQGDPTRGIREDQLAAFSMYQRIAAKYAYAIPNTANWQFSADALVALGNYYRTGIPDTDVTADQTKAQMMYTTAALVFRHPGAQFELGRMQLANRMILGQARLGIRNLKKAAEKDHVGAQAMLGYAYFEGKHLRHDPVRGLTMLSRAKMSAASRELEWINPMHDEAFALATPQEREAAIQALSISVDPFE